MRDIKFLAGTLILTVLMFSCAPKLEVSKKTNGEQKIFYPRQADTAHFQYLRAFSASTDIETQSKFQESIVGKKEALWMVKPYGLTVEKNKIYVADIGIPGLNIIDLKNRTFKHFKPIHKDFSFVLTAAVDTNDDRYIVDSKSMTVVVYDGNGKYKTEFLIPEHTRPVRIRLTEDKIYIADLGTKKIYVYDKKTYELLNTLPKDTIKEDEAYVFMIMDFDLDDKYIYILDSGAFKVKIYDYDGELVNSFGGQGNGYGLFNRPKSIALDKEGNIFVADSTTALVQMFNSEGQALLAFAFPYDIDENTKAPGLYLPTSMYVDYNNNEYFQQYVDDRYKLKYVVMIQNQTGRDLLKVYGRLELK